MGRVTKGVPRPTMPKSILPPKPRSAAQEAAQKRNWAIFNLRGFYHNIPSIISAEDVQTIKQMIDKTLECLNAEPETKRYSQKWEELERAWIEAQTTRDEEIHRVAEPI